MLRLCGESSRPYPGRSVTHARRSVCKIPGTGHRGTKVRAYSVAIAEYERTINSNAYGNLLAPCRATCMVMRQKSAEVIVADAGGNTQDKVKDRTQSMERSLYEFS